MRVFQGGWLALGVTLATLAAGCADKNSKPGSVSRISPRGVPYLEGVPVPGGFDLVKGESTDFESGGQRNARHVYAGWADPVAVRSFYQEQMPLMGWTRMSGENVEGDITLRFEKKSEACVVEIKPTSFLNRIKIYVTVSPFNRISPTPTPTPVEPSRRPVP